MIQAELFTQVRHSVPRFVVIETPVVVPSLWDHLFRASKHDASAVPFVHDEEGTVKQCSQRRVIVGRLSDNVFVVQRMRDDESNDSYKSGFDAYVIGFPQ